jgi:VanZ family protein
LTAFVRYGLPPLVWMALIWGLSTDVGSADNTSGVVVWIATALFPQATPAQIELAHGLIRKLGHLTEYAVLAALWFRALHTGRRLQSTPSALAALAISAAWAIADELHQTLVPSRTASPLDVLLDTTGATLSLLALHARTTIIRFFLRVSPRSASN